MSVEKKQCKKDEGERERERETEEGKYKQVVRRNDVIKSG